MNRLGVIGNALTGIIALGIVMVVSAGCFPPPGDGKEAGGDQGATDQPAPTASDTPQTPSATPTIEATVTAPAQPPTATATATPALTLTPAPASGGLPDLAFGRMMFIMAGHTPGQCVAAYGGLFTTVCVNNRGSGAAGPFAVRLGARPDLWEVAGLAAGGEICLEFSGTTWPNDSLIDPDNRVAESDEDNNMTVIPIPSPPALCTPTP